MKMCFKPVSEPNKVHQTDLSGGFQMIDLRIQGEYLIAKKNKKYRAQSLKVNGCGPGHWPNFM